MGLHWYFRFTVKTADNIALRHNLAHLGHKKLNFDCFECSFVDFFLFKRELTQAQVIKAFYWHKLKTINLLHSFLMSDNIIST